jgi:hypothetical protein
MRAVVPGARDFSIKTPLLLKKLTSVRFADFTALVKSTGAFHGEGRVDLKKKTAQCIRTHRFS